MSKVDDPQESPGTFDHGLGLHDRRVWIRVLTAKVSIKIGVSLVVTIILVATLGFYPVLRFYEDELYRKQEDIGFYLIDRLGPALAAADMSQAAEIGRERVLGRIATGFRFIDPETGAVIVEGGDPPPLEAGDGMERRRDPDAGAYHVRWPGLFVDSPVDIALRLDASFIQDEVNRFANDALRFLGLATVGVVLVLSLTLSLIILAPLLRLHRTLIAAARDSAHPERYTLGSSRRDEIGELYKAFNRLLQDVSMTYRSRLDRLTAAVEGAPFAVAAYSSHGRLKYGNAALLSLCRAEGLEELARRGHPLVKMENGETVGLAEFIGRRDEDSGWREASLILHPDATGAPRKLFTHRLTDKRGKVTSLLAYVSLDTDT